MVREEEDAERRRMRKDPVGSIYKEKLMSGHEKRGGQRHKLSNYKDVSIFRMVFKIRIH